MKKNKRQTRRTQKTVQEAEVEEVTLKGTELALISELMKNSRRSHRELARVIGVSQPTVSRTIKRLEEEGVLKEYTVIPDFRRLGYNLCALIFLKLRELPREEIERIRQAARERLSQTKLPILLIERGMGLGRQAVMACLFRDYASYFEHRNIIKEFPFIQPEDVDSFLIDLNDKIHYRYLTFTGVAQDLLKLVNKNE